MWCPVLGRTQIRIWTNGCRKDRPCVSCRVLCFRACRSRTRCLCSNVCCNAVTCAVARAVIGWVTCAVCCASAPAVQRPCVCAVMCVVIMCAVMPWVTCTVCRASASATRPPYMCAVTCVVMCAVDAIKWCRFFSYSKFDSVSVQASLMGNRIAPYSQN